MNRLKNTVASNSRFICSLTQNLSVTLYVPVGESLLSLPPKAPKGVLFAATMKTPDAALADIFARDNTAGTGAEKNPAPEYLHGPQTTTLLVGVETCRVNLPFSEIFRSLRNGRTIRAVEELQVVLIDLKISNLSSADNLFFIAF